MPLQMTNVHFPSARGPTPYDLPVGGIGKIADLAAGDCNDDVIYRADADTIINLTTPRVWDRCLGIMQKWHIEFIPSDTQITFTVT